MSTRRRLIAFAHADDDPACRFRVRQYMPYLERAGWDVSLRTRRPAYPWITPWGLPWLQQGHTRAGFLWRRARRRWDIHAAGERRFDAVFLNRDLLQGQFRYEAALFRRNPRVVFDFDDAIFLDGKAPHIGAICERAAWVIAGNEYLAAFARRFSPRVAVVPTVVESKAYLRAVHTDRRPVRVGWLGSDQSIRQTLVPYLAMFAALQRDLGFEFVVISRPRPELPATGLRWQFVEWSPRVELEIGQLFDIGVMPLVDDEFQRGKCGCKILQYMSAALPVVASPVGVNAAFLADGRGFTPRDPEGWRQALASLAGDAAARQRMGDIGRAFVDAHYSVDSWFARWLSIIETAAGFRDHPIVA